MKVEIIAVGINKRNKPRSYEKIKDRKKGDLLGIDLFMIEMFD